MTAGAKGLTERATAAPAPPIAPPISTTALRPCVDGLGKLGYDVDSILAGAGLARSDFDDPDGFVSCQATRDIFCGAMAVRPIKNLPVRLAVGTEVGAFPLTDYLVLSSESVGAGIARLAKYFRLINVPGELVIRVDTDPIEVVLEHPGSDFSAEYGLSLTILDLRRETDDRFRAEYVSFTHRLDDPQEAEQLLGCPVRTGAAWCGFAVARDVWQIPFRRGDPVLRELLERQAAEAVARVPMKSEVGLQVRRALAKRLANGGGQVDEIARDLAMSARTLQRRLAADGLSFQGVLDSARHEIAVQYLADVKLSIGEVGYLLGYSEPAAFHRAFKRWQGVTPQAFRQKQRAPITRA